MERNWSGRKPGTLSLALLAAGLAFAPAAAAQEVNEPYILNHLGPAAEQMQAAGVDGSGESSPAIVEISQRWSIEPAFWISVDEVRMLVRAEREDRDARTRLTALRRPIEEYPTQLTLARFGVMKAGLSCGEAQNKARTSQRLADTLSRISQLNGAGTGLVGAISSGATRFVAPMAFATAVTGFAASWAAQLATAYRTAPCWTGGTPWRFGPGVVKTSNSRGLSRTPPHLPGQPGWRPAAWRTGLTFRRRGAPSPFRSPSASGQSWS